ncbi:MAG: cupredoxin domain-containing protein [Bdellovibrionota bacterium]
MKNTNAILFLSLIMLTQSASAEWNVDFSRRARTVRDSDLVDMKNSRGPASVENSTSRPTEVREEVIAPTRQEEKSLLGSLLDAGTPVQEIVILNTDKGFVPSTVHVRKDGKYKIHIVNVNEKEKNVSFILEGFSEYHATVYGKVKTFTLDPKKDGVFSFQSPETAAEGRLVVFAPEITIRNPAEAR